VDRGEGQDNEGANWKGRETGTRMEVRNRTVIGLIKDLFGVGWFSFHSGNRESSRCCGQSGWDLDWRLRMDHGQGQGHGHGVEGGAK
jgi:hypothetical protein